MRRFLQDFHLEIPDMYKEHFHKILPLHKNASLQHEQQLFHAPNTYTVRGFSLFFEICIPQF